MRSGQRNTRASHPPQEPPRFQHSPSLHSKRWKPLQHFESGPERSALQNYRWITCILVFAILLAAYVSTVPPCISSGEAGEIEACWVCGLAGLLFLLLTFHPPTLLLFTLFPRSTDQQAISLQQCVREVGALLQDICCGDCSPIGRSDWLVESSLFTLETRRV